MARNIARNRRHNAFKAQDGLCWWCKKPMLLLTDPAEMYKASSGSKPPDNLATIDHLHHRTSGLRGIQPPGVIVTVCACYKCNQQRAKEEQKRVKQEQVKGGKPVEIKGAFKHLPKKQQPVRIPIEKFPVLAEKVTELLAPHGTVFVPNAVKKTVKETTGDLDVLFIPADSNHWKRNTQNIFVNAGCEVLSKVVNGPQLMMVVKGIIDDQPYMIDVILSYHDSFAFRKFYFTYGGMMPAVMGAFARSLGYKFGQDGLGIRLRDRKGNYHNKQLTNDVETALKLMGLNPDVLATDDLFTPEGLANWLIASPRFDSELWAAAPKADGPTLVVKNKKAHRAAKKRVEVVECFAILDAAVKKGEVNAEYAIENALLGEEFVQKILNELNEQVKKAEVALSGNDVMILLGIKPGPEVGKALAFLKTHPELQNLNPDLPDTKELAKQLLKSHLGK